MGVDFLVGAIALSIIYFIGDSVNNSVNGQEESPFIIKLLMGFTAVGLLYLMGIGVSIIGAIVRTLIF